MKRAILVSVLALAACGPPDVQIDLDRDNPAVPSWVFDPDTSQRVITAADAAATAWGGAPADLDGWTFVLVDHPVGDNNTKGWTRHGLFAGGTVMLDVTYSYPMSPETADHTCPELEAIGHEIGHVIIGDHDHEDARWCSVSFWGRMASTISALVPSSDQKCIDELAIPGRFFANNAACEILGP